ncbi:hypothetical protein N0V90_000457 [Kalmusia sp. IMI 367209]|nr:hypothetical protein N0V90_000457 [Kalmusia sp. IMI 367209]
MLAVVAAAATLADGTITRPPPPEITSAPTGPASSDTCCMPKLCTDDAVIKGTTTQLTYLCPETKTVQVTETVFVTVSGTGEDKPSDPPTPSNDSGDKKTIISVTNKSIVFVTKTWVRSIQDLLLCRAAHLMWLVPSAVVISEPKYTNTSAATQLQPAPTTTVHITSKSTATVVLTRTLKSSTWWSSNTNPVSTHIASSPIWSNSTTSTVVPKPTTWNTTISLIGTSISTAITLLSPTPTSVGISTEGTTISSTTNATLPGYGFSSSSTEGSFISLPGYGVSSPSISLALSTSPPAPVTTTEGIFISSFTDMEAFPAITNALDSPPYPSAPPQQALPQRRILLPQR